MLKLKNINVTVNKQTPLEQKVLTDLNLQVATGEFVIIVGKNGSGKSTLFKTIAGQIVPDSGQILLDTQDVTTKPNYQRANLIANVVQDPKVATMEHLSIEENLCFAYLRGKTRGINLFSNLARKKLFQEKLAILGSKFSGNLKQLVGNLSGGQRQALSLIMATLTDAKILLLDEITAALDPSMAETVMQICAKIVSQEKQTTLMITHNMEHAIRYGDRLLVIDHGQIVREFSKSEKNGLNELQLIEILNKH